MVNETTTDNDESNDQTTPDRESLIDKARAENDTDALYNTDNSEGDWLKVGQPVKHHGPSHDYVWSHYTGNGYYELVAFPIDLLGEESIQAAEHTDGSINLGDSGISEELHERAHESLIGIDLEKLAGEISSETSWSEQEAKVSVLAGWFGMKHYQIADVLDLSISTVRNHLANAKKRYGRAQRTTEYVIPGVTNG